MKEKNSSRNSSLEWGGFDLPVLNYRALITACRADVWRPATRTATFRVQQLHFALPIAHLDLMDVWRCTRRKQRAADEVAQLAGLPGKIRHRRRQGVGEYCGDVGKIRRLLRGRRANTYLCSCAITSAGCFYKRFP